MKLQKFIVVALLVCMIFSSVSFAVTKWSCVGDSITIGMKLKTSQIYPTKLGILLGSEYDIGNFGYSGATMLRAPENGHPYWETSMFQPSQDFQPDIVSIMLGTNDAGTPNWPELEAEFYVDAVDLINVYKNLPTNPRVILFTIPPVKPGSGREPGVFGINAILPDIAAEAGVELLDIYTALINSGLSPQEMWKDLIHINAPAHTVVAETIYNYITGGGPECGDGTCDPGEDQCNCPDDCGTPPSNETSCTDGIDNDCDTDVDCDDSDCIGDPACPTCGDGTCDPGEDQCNCPEDCGTPPSTETSCDDGVDNDCDNDTDCDDADCDGDPACPDCVPKNGACTDNADCCSGNCRPSGKCA